jgi:diacylglycerol kinase family enzyme
VDRRVVRRAALRAGLAAAAASTAARLAGRGELARPAAVGAAVVGATQETSTGSARSALVPIAALAAVVGLTVAVSPGPLGRKRAVAVVGGAGIALASRSLWPVPPGTPAEVRPGRVEQLEPRPDGSGLVVAVNPSAGSSGEDLADELRAALPGARVRELDDPADLVPVLEAAAADSATHALGVAGGDGSINAAAAIAEQHGLPLVVVPGGTLNHLARDLGVAGVADVPAAVRAGTAASVDLPSIAGRRFLNTASFGSYAELVDAREALEERIGKWPALVVALVRVLRRGTPIEVELDGRRRALWMVFIGNCRYHPDGFAPAWRERLDDGVLDVRLVDASSPFSRTRLVAALLTGQLGRSGVYDQWRTTQLVVRSADGPLRLASDGETFDGDGDEVVIAKDGTRLTIYTPACT